MGFSLLDFPTDLLPEVARVLDRVPTLSAHSLIKRVYPYETMMKEEGQKIARDALNTFDLLESGADEFRVSSLAPVGAGKSGTSGSVSEHEATVTLTSSGKGKKHSFAVKKGTKPLKADLLDTAASSSSSSSSYIPNSYHESVLGELFQSHAVRDFCLVGPKGKGRNYGQHSRHITRISYWRAATFNRFYQDVRTTESILPLIQKVAAKRK